MNQFRPKFTHKTKFSNMYIRDYILLNALKSKIIVHDSQTD
jgi:hypothetical protein